MAEIAPLNYERWAVMVSPLVVSGASNVTPASGARRAEQLTQVSASLNRLDSRTSESLIEQGIQSTVQRRKTPKRESEPPLAGSQPAEWIMPLPLPNGIFNAAQNQPALDPRKVTELYEHPETVRGKVVHISG